MDIYGSSKSLYLILKVLGFAPYSVEGKAFKMGFRSYLYFVLSIVVSVLMTSVQLIYNQHCYFDSGIQSKFLESIWQITFIIQHLLTTIAIVFNWLRIKHVENLMSLLHSFDLMVKKLGWRFEARQTQTFGFLVLFLVSTTILATSLLIGTFATFAVMETGITQMLSNCFNYCVITEFYLFISVQLYLSANAINTRLDALIDNVSFMLPINNDEFIMTRSGPAIEKSFLEKVAILYDLLADAVDEINAIFAKQIIIVLIPASLLMIFTTYFIIKVIFFKISITLFVFIDFTLWNFFLVAPIFVVIAVGSLTASKGRKLARYIGNFSNYCSDDFVFQKANALINKINFRPTILSCGFFNIDLTLALSLFGTITTYMVIVCQFESNY